MAENWGPGVSRTLSAFARQFNGVVWQADKPPLDSELNLMSQIEWENLSNLVRSQVHSGFLLDPTRAREDYGTDPLYNNLFTVGNPATVNGNEEDFPVLTALVNGWVIPVAGTEDVGGVRNQIRLYPPPTSDSRTDFVFLEVWQTLIAPNPSTANKPNASEIWKYGNVEFGGTNVPDDLEDPSIGFETTERVQLQYRIRVVGSGSGLGSSVDLATYPDGLTDPQVLGQGTAASPVGGFTFTNMRDELGDPSLWRAGDGNPANALGTIDGYVYAIPMCGVFRRNSSAFTATATAGNPNQNGATERTPSASSLPDPRDGAVTLLQATLTSNITATQTGPITITDLVGSGLDDPSLLSTTPRFLVIGEGIDQEIIAIDGITLGPPSLINVVTPGPGIVGGRGRGGTMAKPHLAGEKVVLYNTRPDGLYADEIASQDILDLRRSVNFGDWDYTRLLQHAVASLAQGKLKSTFKKAGTGGDTIGVVTTEVAYLRAGPTTAPNHTVLMDGPDGIRTVWSDSAATQGDVTLIVDPNANITGAGFTSTTFDVTVAPSWTVGADFQPNGFLNNSSTNGWTNGSVVFIHISGSSGTDGAYAGFTGSPNPKAVRFVSPAEMWLGGEDPAKGQQHPWRLRFTGGDSGPFPRVGPADPERDNGYRAARITTPAAIGEPDLEHPGPMYPLQTYNFEKPFIVLGGLLNPALSFSGIAGTSANFINPVAPGDPYQIRVPGFDWTTYTGQVLLNNTRTLADMLTDGGRDTTGASSQVYIVVYGDGNSRDNNGAFKVIGAGNVSGQYTDRTATTSDGLVVVPLSADFTAFTSNPASTDVRIQVRSQFINFNDDGGRVTGPAGIALVFTDLANTTGGSGNPWNAANVGATYEIQTSGGKLVPLNTKAILDTTLLWSPNRGATPRVPDRLNRFSAVNVGTSYLRSIPSNIDPEFSTEAPFPASERIFDPTQIQLWNRLPSLGLDAPLAPDYGGNVVGSSEQDRENELFFDYGSKTLVFRPFLLQNMTLKAQTTDASPSLIGPSTYSAYGGVVLKDSLTLFTGGGSPLMGFPVPPEYMPRFGRQDIPYHVRTTTTDPLLPGINHLFPDQTDPTANVFYIVGGLNNAGPSPANLVNPILFTTDTVAIPYGQDGTVGGLPHAAYGGRKQFLPNVVSSDLGVGMRGIELPPYLGIARLYGVYELNDFLANGDPLSVGGFATDRLTPTGNLTNLLRTDATKQTLFIRQGGGNDVTGTDNAHTYLVPESAIDVSLVPGFNPATDTFDTFDYVVECVVFGFAEGFINENNYVLCRQRTGSGLSVSDGQNPELTNVAMMLPSAADRGDALYAAYERTVYQGDPYMTRDGSTIQIADYSARVGQIPQSSAFQLATPIQQFDPLTGNMIVERPNPRALQVLATMDFYTTIGTGKIGGKFYPGTVIDAGYLDDSTAGALDRIPASSLALPWPTTPRAFTESQSSNDSRASISVQLTNANLINGTTATLRVTVTPATGSAVTFDGGVDFVGSNTLDLAADLAANINASASLSVYMTAFAIADRVVLVAKAVGTEGNANAARIGYLTPPSPFVPVNQAAQILDGYGLGFYPSNNTHPVGAQVTQANFSGGVDLPVNAGTGDSAVSLGGMTERFPLGILVSDSDFLSENPLGDNASMMRTYLGGVRPVYSNLPLTENGLEYDRFLNDPGSLVSMSDGGILLYTPYTDSTPGGTRKFRLYRGGGTAFVLSGAAPGGPIDWVSDSFQSILKPVLKGAALAGKALLVRNFHEEAFSVSNVRSEGDEIQLIILTQAVYGDGDTQSEGVTLSGQISPTGYGEGYSAADRYLLEGRPMDRGRTRTTPDPALQPAPFFKE